MMKLVYYGDPILRKKAQEVEKIDEEIVKLVHEMDKTMMHYRGVGLAAPQVGKSIRLFILRDEYQNEKEEWVRGPLQVFINPVLKNPDTELVSMNEGCLSIPGIRANIMRPKKMVVEATNLKGERFTQEYEGLVARIIMHENDHINGVLFIDRLSKKERDQLEMPLRELKKKFTSKS